jgi:SAM-dependent methyltransferase
MADGQIKVDNGQSRVSVLRRGIDRLRVALGRRRNLTADSRARAAGVHWREHAGTFADHYEPRGSGTAGRLARLLLDRRVRLLEGWLRVTPGARTLELGCGHGLHLAALARQGARVTGVDVSAQMLARSRQTLAAAGAEGGELVCAAAESVELPAGAYDLVIAVGLLGYLPAWRAVLGRLAGFAKSGCPVIFSIPKRPSPFFFLRRGPGLLLRRAIFELPPLPVAATRGEVEQASRAAGLELEEVVSCLGTTWLIRARRRASGPGGADQPVPTAGAA